jgi:hypothetical protein
VQGGFVNTRLQAIIDTKADTAEMGIGQLEDEVVRLRSIVARAKTALEARADDLCKAPTCTICDPFRILEEA